MKNFIAFVTLLAPILVFSQEKIAFQDSAHLVELRTYVQSHHQIPEDYVISKFKDHDVVFIGEYHRIKHDPLLIQRLIPRLHAQGIFSLGYEFARREDQPLIDSLLSAPVYDEGLARRILFKGFVFWGYQEYANIFKAAWQVNQGLPPGARRFRILGLGDSPDWSLIKTQEDRDNPVIKRKVWRGGGGEEFWAKVILDEVVAKNEKALVYSGMHHAFTEYKQPIYTPEEGFIRFEENRTGNHVHRAIGKRTITIFLHSPWPSVKGYEAEYVHPADGAIEALLATLPDSLRRFGCDTRGTPFGDLTGATALYQSGYDHFTLATFCDGYICQGPLADYQGVTPIADFINQDNIETARLQSPNPVLRKASIEDFNEGIKQDADIPRRFQHLR